jgi:hypothetical protein
MRSEPHFCDAKMRFTSFCFIAKKKRQVPFLIYLQINHYYRPSSFDVSILLKHIS